MELESARALKLELLAREVVPPGLVGRDLTALGRAARRAGRAAEPQPSLALGVAPGDRGAFRLAVRVQQRALLRSERLAGLREAARGEVDVRYVGRVAKQQAPGLRERQRPVLIGSSVGHYAITAGTVGAFVRREGIEDAFLLSNNHVLADENRGRLGDEVLQPGRADGGRRPQDVVGVLDRFVALAPEGVNLVDCALAAVDPGVELDPRTLTGLGELAPGLAAPEEAEAVAKVGRTTGVTRGRVSAFEVDNVVVGFEAGSLRFDDQLELSPAEDEPFSQGGDSGSLIVTDDLRPLGLLFAGSDQGGPEGNGVTFANPIATVLARLQAQLVV